MNTAARVHFTVVVRLGVLIRLRVTGAAIIRRTTVTVVEVQVAIRNVLCEMILAFCTHRGIIKHPVRCANTVLVLV